MKLTNLLKEFHGTQAEYLDIVNYEIARENICSYIFLLSRISQNAEPTEKYADEDRGLPRKNPDLSESVGRTACRSLFHDLLLLHEAKCRN